MKKRFFALMAAGFLVLPCFLFISKSFREKDTESPSSVSVIVMFQTQSSPDSQAEVLHAFNSTIIWHENDAALIELCGVSDFEQSIAALRNHPLVEEAEEDAPLFTLSYPNDPYLDSQWAINNPGRYSYISETGIATASSLHDVDMNVTEMWDFFDPIVSSPRPVTVAVIDTGVDITHSDLRNNIWVNEGEIPGDGIDNDNNGYIDDINGWDFYHDDNTLCHYEENDFSSSKEDNDNHGTHIAGIIGAEKNNAIGIAGVASNIDIKIMPLKIHGSKTASGTISDAVRAIRYATAMGADICNISWGTTKASSTLKQAIIRSDMLFIAAAGNSGDDNDRIPMYPASYNLDNVISVTSVDANGDIPANANTGVESVDIAAPGVHIYSTIVGSYAFMSGTSMAAPHVSAVAAMLYAYSDQLYPKTVKDILLSTYKPIDSLKNKIRTPGIPDAAKALFSIHQLKKDYYVPTLSFESGFDQNGITIKVTAKDSGKSGIRCIRYAAGQKDASYFKRGTEGTSVNNKATISITKAGPYSFYVSDYSGNERVVIYVPKDDVTPPEATLSYTVAYNNNYSTVNVSAKDAESGIKTATHVYGDYGIEDFLDGNLGSPLVFNNHSAKFTAIKQGIYTIYLCDYRGNREVFKIDVRIKNATDLTLKRYKKTMKVGDSYTILPTLSPIDSTDRLKYYTDDAKICKVSTSGKVTALSPGKTKITVRTSGGLSRVCQITVIGPTKE